MGEVYLAQDTKLDRKVALKILPADLAANQDRMRRFVQEAKAAAALNHPNIAHIYEIGEERWHELHRDGVCRRRDLAREDSPRRAEFGNLLKHLLQVAEGLSKAHAAGNCASRSQTRQHHDDARRPREDSDFGLAKLEQRPQEKGILKKK